MTSKPKDHLEIPEADALEQARSVDDELDEVPIPSTPPDASEADALDQSIEVPDEDGYEPRS